MRLKENILTNQLLNYSNRDCSIDIYKGIGIILMVLDHIAVGYYFGYGIHSFHMPMFFFASGLLFKGKTNIPILAYTKKKAKSLLIPYLLFGMVGAVLYTITNGIDTDVLSNLLFYNTRKMPIVGAIWFLTSFFISVIGYYIFTRLFYDKPIFLTIIICLLGLAGTVGGLNFLPWGGAAAAVGIVFIYIGDCVRRTAIVLRTVKMCPIWVSMSLFAVSVLLTFKNEYVNMRLSNYGNVIIFWVTSVTAVISLYSIACHLSTFKAISEVVGWFGRNSLLILGSNQIFIAITQKLLSFTKLIGFTMTIATIILVFIEIYMFCTLYNILKSKVKSTN